VSRLGPESSRRARICLAVAALSAVPASMLVAGFSAEAGFLRFLVVGRVFEARALPELREARPPLDSEDGYDGQLYAQLALDPTLRRAELRQALDSPAYRSRRIGLPALAHLLGFGRPQVVLQIYALLNFAFWAALLAAFLRHVGLERPRDFLLAAALLWNTGTLVSLERALTDFPAMALGLVAVWQTSRKLTPAGLMSAACLVRETSILQILALGRPERERSGLTRLLVTWAIVLLPIAAWSVYVWWNVSPPAPPGRAHIALPFVSLATKLLAAGNDLSEVVRGSNQLFPKTFELLAPMSLAVQAIYLIRHPRPSSRAWRFGVGFVALLFFVGHGIWVEQYAFCRIFLPLTAAFNLLVHEHEERTSYARWFFAGNVGMIWMLLEVLRG